MFSRPRLLFSLHSHIHVPLPASIRSPLFPSLRFPLPLLSAPSLCRPQFSTSAPNPASPTPPSSPPTETEYPPARLPPFTWPRIDSSPSSPPLPCLIPPVPPPSPAASAPAVYKRVIKETTGLTGLPVVPNGDDVLIGLYAEILLLLSEYRDDIWNRHMWNFTVHRLKLAMSSVDISDLEQKINLGEIEELIRYAEDDLDLIITVNHHPETLGLGYVPGPEDWVGQDGLDEGEEDIHIPHLRDINMDFRSFDELLASVDPHIDSIEFPNVLDGFEYGGKSIREIVPEWRRRWFRPMLPVEVRQKYVADVEKQIEFRSSKEYRAELLKHKKNLQFLTPQFIEFLHTELITKEDVNKWKEMISKTKRRVKCEPPFVLEIPADQELDTYWRDFALTHVESSHRSLYLEEIVMCAEVLVKELESIGDPDLFITLKERIWIIGGIDKETMAKEPQRGTIPNAKLLSAQNTVFKARDFTPLGIVPENVVPKHREDLHHPWGPAQKDTEHTGGEHKH